MDKGPTFFTLASSSRMRDFCSSLDMDGSCFTFNNASLPDTRDPQLRRFPSKAIAVESQGTGDGSLQERLSCTNIIDP